MKKLFFLIFSIARIARNIMQVPNIFYGSHGNRPYHTARRTVLVPLCIALVAVACAIVVSGCEIISDLTNSNNNTTDYMYGYVCENGTKAEGAADSAGVTKCSECDDGFIKNDDACVAAHDYVCQNGTAADGQTTADNTNKCHSCDDFFKLDGNNCVATAYTCQNGDPVEGGPSGNEDAENCKQCDTGFIKNGNACATAYDYVCQNGTAADGQTTADNTNKCHSCDNGYLLDSESCEPFGFSSALAISGSITANNANLTANATHPATLYWVVYASGTQKTDVATVIGEAADDSAVNVVARSGTAGVTVDGDIPHSFSISGLSANTNYTVYAAITASADSNLAILSAAVNFTTTQEGVPTFTAQPTAPDPQQTTATIGLTADENTPIYWVLYSSVQTVTTTTLKSAAQGSVGGNVIAVSGENDAIDDANGEKEIPISGLSPLTDYYFYALLEDEDDNQTLSGELMFSTIGYPFVCDYGMADTSGQLKNPNTVKCTSCNDYYKPDGNDNCVQTVYTCTNGDAVTDSSPLQDKPTVTDINADVAKCKKCHEGYKLTDSNSCVELQYGERDTNNEFNLSGSNGNPYGMWGNDASVWVANDAGGFSKLFAYTLSTGKQDTSKEFNLITTAENYNGDPRGIWSDGTTMWVAENTGTTVEKVFAYTLSTGVRDTSKEYNLDGDNRFPAGIWSDGSTMWVVNDMWLGGGFGNPAYYKAFAYTLADGSRDSTKEFNLTGAQDDPTGMWSDGTTIWIADEVDHKLYAYTLATGNRDSSKEFNLNSANRDPVGIWGDGTTLWVADSVDDKLYAYHIKTE